MNDEDNMSEDKQTARVWWSKHVREAKAIRGVARAVAYFLASVADAKGESFYSQREISDGCGFAVRPVRDALHELEAMGVIVVSPPTPRRLTPTYRLIADALVRLETPAPSAGDAGTPGANSRYPRRETPNPPAGDADKESRPSIEAFTEGSNEATSAHGAPTHAAPEQADPEATDEPSAAPSSGPSAAPERRKGSGEGAHVVGHRELDGQPVSSIGLASSAVVLRPIGDVRPAGMPVLTATDDATVADEPTAQPALPLGATAPETRPVLDADPPPHRRASDAHPGGDGGSVEGETPASPPVTPPSPGSSAGVAPSRGGGRRAKRRAEADAGLLAAAQVLDRIHGRVGVCLPGSARWDLLASAVRAVGLPRVLARLEAVALAVETGTGPAASVVAWMRERSVAWDAVLRGSTAMVTQLDAAVEDARGLAAGASGACEASGGPGVGGHTPAASERSQVPFRPNGAGSVDAAWSEVAAAIARPVRSRPPHKGGPRLHADEAEHDRRAAALAPLWGAWCDAGHPLDARKVEADWKAAMLRVVA